MLSIDEVRNISFRKANLGGYRPEDVNSFIDEVVATLEQDKKDKIDLVKKLDILAKRIEEYRKDEESVRGALINAEKVKETAVKESSEKADYIIKEAQTKANQIVYDANASVVEQKNNYLRLQADAVVLREQLLETYNNHIRMLEDLPTSSEISKKKSELDKTYPTTDTKATIAAETVSAEESKDELVDITAETAVSEESKTEITEHAE
ncbi:MAG TPA: DivIVA domain-containing protein [Clostridiales bacterium]|nr:DivIVA domain-containing protein [Clostridiales bacterium]